MTMLMELGRPAGRGLRVGWQMASQGAAALLIAFDTVGAGSCLLLLTEKFPARVRATCLSIVYSIGVSVFGGFAQFIVTWLNRITGDPISPDWYVSAGAVAMLCVALRMREVALPRKSGALSVPELSAG